MGRLRWVPFAAVAVLGAATASIAILGAHGRAQTTVAVQTIQGATVQMTHYVTTVTTGAGGTFSGTWPNAFPAAPFLTLTPIVTGSSAIECELTAAPTVSAFQGRCWTASPPTLLNLSIITAGLTISNNTASGAGVVVEVHGVSPSQ